MTKKTKKSLKKCSKLIQKSKRFHTGIKVSILFSRIDKWFDNLHEKIHTNIKLYLKRVKKIYFIVPKPKSRKTILALKKMAKLIAKKTKTNPRKLRVNNRIIIPDLSTIGYQIHIKRAIFRYQRKHLLRKFRLARKASGKRVHFILSKPLYRGLAYATVSLFVIFSGLFYWLVLYQLPTPYALKDNRSSQTTIIRDRKERVLYKVYKNANRINLTFEEIPDAVKNATIAIEVAAFYRHPGISVKSIFRALIYNVKEDNINLYQGGSTITQQLIKN